MADLEGNLARNAALKAAKKAAEDPRWAEIYKGIKQSLDTARGELQAFIKAHPDDFELLKDYLGTGPNKIGADPQEALRKGISPEMLEVYKKFNKILAEAPAELRPLLDPANAQLSRLSPAALGSLSAGWIAAVILAGLIAADGAYRLYKKTHAKPTYEIGQDHPKLPTGQTLTQMSDWCSEWTKACVKTCDRFAPNNLFIVECQGSGRVTEA